MLIRNTTRSFFNPTMPVEWYTCGESIKTVDQKSSWDHILHYRYFMYFMLLLRQLRLNHLCSSDYCKYKSKNNTLSIWGPVGIGWENKWKWSVHSSADVFTSSLTVFQQGTVEWRPVDSVSEVKTSETMATPPPTSHFIYQRLDMGWWDWALFHAGLTPDELWQDFFNKSHPLSQ